jgi:hypothetical protein
VTINEVVHVRETTVIAEQAIDTEDADHARAAVLAHLDRLSDRASPSPDRRSPASVITPRPAASSPGTLPTSKHT